MKTIGVVAFAFGRPWTLRSNRLIAEIATKRAQEDDAPIFTQEDICFPDELGLKVTYIKNKDGRPPSTLQIARRAVRWAEANFFDELIVVAAGPHMWRCLRDIDRVAKEEARVWWLWTVIRPQWGISTLPKENWFCRESTQSWTTSEREWQKRDWVVQFMPFWLYKKIAV